MNENSNNSLTKTFELNIIEDQENNLKDLKECSGLSYLKGNYIPPSDNLSYFSGSGLINKFKITRLVSLLDTTLAYSSIAFKKYLKLFVYKSSIIIDITY